MPKSSSPEPKRVAVFTDLDNCLFQSLHRMHTDSVRVATVTREGQPQAGMSAAQEQLWSLLQHADVLIPTTGRTEEQMRRVKLVFTGPSICLQGALILDETGNADSHWWEMILSQSLQLQRVLGNLEHTLTRRCDVLDVWVESIVREGTIVFLKIRPKVRSILPDWVEIKRAVADLLPQEWSPRIESTEMLILPPHVGKEYAVQHLIQQMSGGPLLTIGIGGGEADLPFMSSCHFSVRLEDRAVAQ